MFDSFIKISWFINQYVHYNSDMLIFILIIVLLSDKILFVIFWLGIANWVMKHLIIQLKVHLFLIIIVSDDMFLNFDDSVFYLIYFYYHFLLFFCMLIIWTKSYTWIWYCIWLKLCRCWLNTCWYFWWWLWWLYLGWWFNYDERMMSRKK